MKTNEQMASENTVSKELIIEGGGNRFDFYAFLAKIVSSDGSQISLSREERAFIDKIKCLF